MIRTSELQVPARNFYTETEKAFSFNKLRGLFWYPRLGWESGWVPHVNNGTQPNRGYQNRPLNGNQGCYTTHLWWNRISNPSQTFLSQTLPPWYTNQKQAFHRNEKSFVSNQAFLQKRSLGESNLNSMILQFETLPLRYER
ncbi:hypothetical protein AVEN_56742-1 [Araneus ventricosus]|uniref:Uncharacterized protein n=1 Tax=Araneus ventricosus TaxID=182803 RepID=A0A4Y2IT67_ARAVE|nr:hypothetical protein AVEN_56742-1 [Araneus ventricosus]